MKVVTIAGTRPEWIRLARIIAKLDRACEHVLVDTNQNYDPNLRDVFFKELGIRRPDYQLGMDGKDLGGQLATLMFDLYPILLNEKPDAFLVLGDTNSSLGAILAKRLGIRVFHMEAGNRCFDKSVPEEANRKIIDHASDILLPYTERSRQNLLAEGIPGKDIYVTGNPITEVVDYYQDRINDVLPRPTDYFLVTLHRQENVDNLERLGKFIEALTLVATNYEMPIVWSVHPRTRKQLEGVELHELIELHEPFGFFEFISLEQNAFCVLTDSGTVQEECAIFGVPVVTLRDTTERPETIEAGNNFISGCEPERILSGVSIVLNSAKFAPPFEYTEEDVSDKIVKIVLGYYK